MAVGDIYECVIKVQNIARRDYYVNVLHYQMTADGPTEFPERSLGMLVDSSFRVNVLPLLNIQIGATIVTTQRIFPLPRTAGWIQDSNSGETGAVGGDMLPGQCAMVIKKRTALAGRRYRGRVFVFGMSESGQANGLFADGVMTALVNAWTNLLVNDYVDADGSTYTPVVVRKRPTASGQATEVTSLAGDRVVRTQRRRTNGVGS